MTAGNLLFWRTVAIVMSLGILPTPVVMQTQPPVPGQSPQTPPFPVQDVKQCWSSFASVNGCLSEIYASFIIGRVASIGPSCCQAIISVSASCWPKMFPYNPYFPPLLKAYCAFSGVKHSETGRAPVTAPTPTPTPSEYNPAVASSPMDSQQYSSASSSRGTSNPFDPTAAAKCLLSLQKTEGCYHEVITSVFSSQVGLLGPRCCRAIAVIDESCWPRIFPFNPFFPPLINTYCENLPHKTPKTHRHTLRD